MQDTIFDKILAKKIPATIVYEDDIVLAFKDINPQAKIHVVVIPKKRARNFAELIHWSSEDIGKFFLKVSHVAHELGLPDKGFRIVLNTGHDGGQSVDYIHAHILGGQVLSGSFH